jgi:hypothetical protein
MLGNGILTQQEGSQALYTWQATATTSPAALTSQVCNEVVVQNDPGSSNDLYVGNSSSQVIVLVPGASIVIPVCNANLVYLKTATGTADVNIIARS